MSRRRCLDHTRTRTLKDILHLTVCSAQPNPITFLITRTSWLLRALGFIRDFTFLGQPLDTPAHQLAIRTWRRTGEHLDLCKVPKVQLSPSNYRSKILFLLSTYRTH